MLMIIDNTRRPQLSQIPFWQKQNLATRHSTCLSLVTDKRRAQTYNTILLCNLHSPVKINNARQMGIQVSDALAFCDAVWRSSDEPEMLHW